MFKYFELIFIDVGNVRACMHHLPHYPITLSIIQFNFIYSMQLHSSVPLHKSIMYIF